MSKEFAERADGLLWFHEGELLCPCDGAPLARGEVSGIVACTRCSEAFLVSHGDRHCHDGHGVPVLLVDAGVESDQQETINAFSRKWDFDPDAVREERFRIANAWFLDRFTTSWRFRGEPVFFSSGRPSPEIELEWFLQDKHRILDAGCGLGNLTTLLAQSAPHAEVWGVDLSTAIFKIKRADNVRLVQCDLRDVPIAGTFDLIVSDGVLHHTSSTRDSLYALVDRLAPGGDILFHVYRKKAPIREFTDDWIRARVTEMTHEETMELCRALVGLGRQLREADVKIMIDRDIPALGIESGTFDLQRFVYWHFLKCFWDDGGNVNASIIENYDWYAPKLAWRHTEDEVWGWIEEHTHLELVHLTSCESGFSVHARWV